MELNLELQEKILNLKNDRSSMKPLKEELKTKKELISQLKKSIFEVSQQNEIKAKDYIKEINEVNNADDTFNMFLK